jgi:AraC-like DNA-binding protein/quercetin dioxygenase-like cupin family protein
MKAIYEQLSLNAENSFLYRQFSLPQFDAPFHYHPELELTYIEQGEGRRFVGQQISNFETGDLVLLGENVPHCWLNTEAVGLAKATVIQFKKDFVGDTFLNLPELRVIQQLFQKAQSGIAIKGETQKKVIKKMDFKGLNAFQKLIQLIEILHIIAISDEIELIDAQFSVDKLSTMDTARFQKIYAFIIENYQYDIELNTISAIAHLTPTAFCRYFKKITRKTLVDVVTEFRVKHACQLLTSTEKTVANICFESGFGNISYFNKAFKKTTGHSPLEYRKLYFRMELNPT